MARVDNGNNLQTPMLQPGWVTQADGYGLITTKGRYVADEGNANSFNLGQEVPDLAGTRISKITQTFNKNGLQVIDLEGVQLDSATTRPNVSASSGLTSEHITTHPDFFSTIAGPKPYTQSTLSKGNGQTLYKGLNGAHFSDEQGGKFEGFLDPSFPDFYGKTHYLAPITSFSGTIFTSSSANAKKLKDAVGKTSASRSFDGITLLPSFLGDTFVISGRHQLLLSQVNFEDYAVTVAGNAYVIKVTYEIRLNAEGYSSKVYKSA